MPTVKMDFIKTTLHRRALLERWGQIRYVKLRVTLGILAIPVAPAS